MSIGRRLREERERLGFTQPDFARLAGASKGTQIQWEKDGTSPSALALNAFADAGADVLYILTGRRADGSGDGASAAESRIAVLEAKVAAGEYLTADQAAELAGIATASGMADRTRAYADRVLRALGDADAENRHREREARRDAAMRMAQVRVADICGKVRWDAPASTMATLVRLIVDCDVGDDHLESLVVEMRRLAENGTS